MHCWCRRLPTFAGECLQLEQSGGRCQRMREILVFSRIIFRTILTEIFRIFKNCRAGDLVFALIIDTSWSVCRLTDCSSVNKVPSRYLTEKNSWHPTDNLKSISCPLTQFIINQWLQKNLLTMLCFRDPRKVRGCHWDGQLFRLSLQEHFIDTKCFPTGRVDKVIY